MEIKCPICNAELNISSESYDFNQIFLWWRKEGYEFSNEVVDTYRKTGQTTLMTCTHCEFGIFNPPITGTGLFYEELATLGKSWYYLEEKWEYQQALSDLKNCQNVLDVGCGRGVFIEKLAKQGKKALGLELNADAASIARDRGLLVYERPLKDFSLNHQEQYDGVCLFQVLEHVESPVQLLSDAIISLKPGGLLIISVPSVEGYLSKIGPVVTNVPPHHISRWTANAFNRLATGLGMRVCRIKFEPFSHYGFLRLIWIEKLQQSTLPDYIKASRIFNWICHPPNMVWKILYKTLSALFPNGIPIIKGHSLYVVLKKT